MLHWLADPISYAFMQRSLLASLMVGILCAVIGCYVALRAIAYLVHGNLLLGGLIAAVIVALGIGFFSRQGELKEDTAIGILFAAALALGVALISSIRTYAADLTHILFGNILGVSPGDLWLTAGLGGGGPFTHPPLSKEIF